jgi:hypothetical protein
MKAPVADLMTNRKAETSLHSGICVWIKRLIYENFSALNPNSPQDLGPIVANWDPQLSVQIVEIERQLQMTF